MNKPIIIIIFLLIVSACQKKSVPTITGRTSKPNKEKSTPLPGTIAPDTAIGKIIFVNRCGKCHGLPLPSQFNEKMWGEILISMMPKARLKNEQKIHLTAYVMDNAKKG